MEIYERKTKWSNKVNWIIAITMYMILLIVFFLLFYFLLGKQTELVRPIITSIIVSTLLVISFVYSSVLKYEDYMIVISKKKKYLIIEQKESDFIYSDANIKRLKDYNNRHDIEELISKPEKNIGINVYEINKCDMIKEKNKRYLLRVKGTNNKWIYKENKKTIDYSLSKKEEERKIVIYKDIDNYDELIKDIKE